MIVKSWQWKMCYPPLQSTTVNFKTKHNSSTKKRSEQFRALVSDAINSPLNLDFAITEHEMSAGWSFSVVSSQQVTIDEIALALSRCVLRVALKLTLRTIAVTVEFASIIRRPLRQCRRAQQHQVASPEGGRAQMQLADFGRSIEH